MKIVNRIASIPEYLFSKVEDIKRKLISEGVNIIDLGIGDPDIPTPDFIVESMQEHIKNVNYHRYPPYNGIKELRDAVAEYYKGKYNVQLDPDREVLVVLGSKEGIAHLFLALTDNKDYVLIPDPGYPVYQAAALIAGCTIYRMNLLEKNNYLPKLENIYPQVARKAKLLIVNYPNNPTGAVANLDFYKNLVDFGKSNDISIVNDGAYIDILRPEQSPISYLQAPGAKDTGVEFGTLSKSFNMAGWRIGYVAGSSEIIKKLMVVKSNFDSGQFSAIQMAGAEALKKGQSFTAYLNETYEERRKYVTEALINLGFDVFNSIGTFYIWFKVPQKYKSMEFAAHVLKYTGIIITPGNAYGSSGEGYCRISLTNSIDKFKEAMDRLTKLDCSNNCDI